MRSHRFHATDSNSGSPRAKRRAAAPSTAPVLFSSIGAGRSVVITTRSRRMASRSYSPTRTIFCASSRTKLNRRLRMMRGRTFGANQAQIFAVFALGQSIDQPFEFGLIDEVLPE